MGKLRVIDLFAGCGGLSAGFEATGCFTPVAAVESDIQAAATYAHNLGDHVFVGDIADWAEGSMPRADVVIGGPPCQGFSALGRRDPNDPRNKLWRHYVDVLARVRPAFFVIENVPQFLRSIEFARLQRETSGLGQLAPYELEPFVLNAADYGVPQARKRAVVIGRRRELAPVGAPPSSTPRVLRDAFPAWLDARVDVHDIPRGTIEFRGRAIPGRSSCPSFTSHAWRRPFRLPATKRFPPEEAASTCRTSFRLLVGASTLAARATSWDGCRGTSPQ